MSIPTYEQLKNALDMFQTVEVQYYDAVLEVDNCAKCDKPHLGLNGICELCGYNTNE